MTTENNLLDPEGLSFLILIMFPKDIDSLKSKKSSKHSLSSVSSFMWKETSLPYCWHVMQYGNFVVFFY